MSENSQPYVVRAQDLRVDAEVGGRPVIVAKLPTGEAIGISLDNQLMLKMIWLLLMQAGKETEHIEPLSRLSRGIINLPDALPVNELGFVLSHDHSHVVLALRFGEVVLPIRLDPSTAVQLRQRIAEVERAIATHSTSAQ